MNKQKKSRTRRIGFLKLGISNIPERENNLSAHTFINFRFDVLNFPV